MTLRKEETRDILGVSGRAFNVVAWAGNGNEKAPNEIANQKWMSESRPVDESYWGKGAKMRVTLRFDDNCKNGHPSFGFTGEIYRPTRRDVEACGCLHDEAAQYFPELKSLLQHHLCSTDGPMHYAANAVYHASNRDHWGRAPGDVSEWAYAVYFDSVPIRHSLKKGFWEWLKDAPNYDFEVLGLSEHKKEAVYAGFTFGGYPGAENWHKCPFKSDAAAIEFLEALQKCEVRFERIPVKYSEGKPRDLDAARRAANWPDAPDSILTADKETLMKAVNDRLPALIERFKTAMVDDCGFLWSATE